MKFAEIDRAMASALEQAPVGDRYAQVSYETLVKNAPRVEGYFFGPCNERLMLKAMRLYGAFATLNVRFSNDKLLSMGMPKPPRFTDYIDRCVQNHPRALYPAADGRRFLSKHNAQVKKCQSADWHLYFTKSQD